MPWLGLLEVLPIHLLWVVLPGSSRPAAGPAMDSAGHVRFHDRLLSLRSDPLRHASLPDALEICKISQTPSYAASL